MKDSKDITSYMEALGAEAKKASQALASLSTEKKNSTLNSIAEFLEKGRSEILVANEEDLSKANSKAIGEALIDRLKLTLGLIP